MINYEKDICPVCGKKNYLGTHDEVVDSYNKREKFSKFIGGAIVTQEQLDEVLYTDEEGNETKVSDKYRWFETVDGDLFLTFMRMVTPTAWISVENDEFYELADKYGIDKVKTKSEMEALIPVPVQEEI